MIHVGVKELKNHLSRYLKIAQAGETIRVTDRGEVIMASARSRDIGLNLPVDFKSDRPFGHS